MVVPWLLVLVFVFVPRFSGAEEKATTTVLPPIEAFQPGETLTYDISWSNIVTAGTAVMEVKRETIPDGREVLVFDVTGHSAGIVDKIIKVQDTVKSVFDPLSMQSLSYSLRESYGKKKRRRELVFDHIHNTVVSKLNDDPSETFAVPEQILDVLSTLYYIRMQEDFIVGKPLTIDVHDSGKNWSVEVQTLGREKVSTRAGEFSTIEVRIYPRYQGVFLNKGEAFIWLTDDRRKIPVKMKSKLKVGSFVFTLTGMKAGEEWR